MYSVLGRAARLCDMTSRRELLTVGSLSLLGLSLPQLLESESTARADSNVGTFGSGFGKAESVIVVYLQGSPSHIDLWDPKPDAPAEIRGEFKPIATSAPGMSLGEVLPMLAKEAHRFSIVR